jgi:hypothetical protein
MVLKLIKNCTFQLTYLKHTYSSWTSFTNWIQKMANKLSHTNGIMIKIIQKNYLSIFQRHIIVVREWMNGEWIIELRMNGSKQMSAMSSYLAIHSSSVSVNNLFYRGRNVIVRQMSQKYKLGQSNISVYQFIHWAYNGLPAGQTHSVFTLWDKPTYSYGERTLY